MNTKRRILIASAPNAWGIAVLHAGPRTSASYSIATDSADAGGKLATGARRFYRIGITKP